MSCDLQALANVDSEDPGQLQDLLQQCTSALEDPTLWYWAVGFTVVSALVGAIIGHYKKAVVRDTILGLALGPIGWIISLCLQPPKPKPVCPTCRSPIDAGDAHCRRCGAKLNASG